MYHKTLSSPISHSPIFNLEGLAKLYKVRYKLTQQLPTLKEVILTYTIQVELIKSTNNNHIIQINRTLIESNNIKNHAYDLAEKCGQILFPIQLNVNEAAQITGLHNHPEIVNRWLTQSPLFSKYYSGEAAADYIKETEQSILNPDAILKALSNDLFLNFYFLPIYSFKNDVSPTNLSFPNISNKEEPIVFQTNLSLLQKNENNPSLFIQIEGKWFENPIPIKEIQKNIPQWSLLTEKKIASEPLPDATIDGLYELNKTTQQIESILFNGRVNTANNQYHVKMQINKK